MQDARGTRGARWSLPLGQPGQDERLQGWLYRSLRQAILDGRLPPNALLPGSRTLALEHGIARGTVQAVYAQLLSEGYVITGQGSATRVSNTLPDASLLAGPARASRYALAPAAPEAAAPSGSWAARIASLSPPFPLRPNPGLPPPFHPHRCDVSAFPVDLWRRLHARHLRTSRLAALSETDAAGLPALRAAISRYLDIARGVPVSPDQILILNSVQQAIDLSLRVLVGHGETVWMEDPGYPGARQIMRAAGAHVVDVPVDAEGLRVADGVAAAPAARLAYVTPARHAPLGMPMSLARRTALLRWARESGAYILEDDYDSEYRFSAKPIPALRSHAGGDTHVLLAGTFSKLLYPGIRLAYMVLPAHLIEPFVRIASLTGRNANGLTQAVLADFMDDGHFDHHVRRMRRIYASRADAFLDSARRHWDGLLDVAPPSAGLDTPARLLAHTEEEARARLAAAGITAFPLRHYSSGATVPAMGEGLVMGYAAFDADTIDGAARLMAQALRA